MSKLEELLKKHKEIEDAIEAEMSKGREDAVANVRTTIKTYGITLSEVKNALVMRKPRSTKKKLTELKSSTGVRRGRPVKNNVNN